MPQHACTTFSDALNDRRLWIMGAYGAVCGLPLPLSGFTLRQWLSEGQVSLGLIGATASIGLAYVLKFLWSPLLDQVRPPLGLARFGRRRGWLLAIQPLLALACLMLAWSDPAARPYGILAVAALVAFLSASQDVVVDAWRVETFPTPMQGMALAVYVWGYRLALLISGAGAIGLVGTLGWGWSLSLMALLVGAGALVTAFAPEPGMQPMASVADVFGPSVAQPEAQPAAATQAFAARLRWAVVEPFLDFLRRPNAWAILAFVMLFKLGEALAHTMAPSFYSGRAMRCCTDRCCVWYGWCVVRYPQRESNPSFDNENVASWPLDDGSVVDVRVDAHDGPLRSTNRWMEVGVKRSMPDSNRRDPEGQSDA